MHQIKPFKVGVTGGIGSGKTTVCRIIESLGLPVYYSDAKAIELIHTNQQLIAFYKQQFGEDIYICGRLDRPRVAGLLFGNAELVAKVGQVVHPAVQLDFDEWALKQCSNVVFSESALLFESGRGAFFDAVIAVVAPLDLRVSRVMRRDGVSKKEVLARINHQWSDEKKCEMSQYVIYSDDKQMVIPQVLKIFNIIAGERK